MGFNNDRYHDRRDLILSLTCWITAVVDARAQEGAGLDGLIPRLEVGMVGLFISVQ